MIADGPQAVPFRAVRAAAVALAGFLAVFAISLVAARGSKGPALRRTPFCGVWKPGPTPAPRSRPSRYVAYAHSTSCARALQTATAYAGTHVCRHVSQCKARIGHLRCRTAGTAGSNLGWIGCYSNANFDPPRVFFSVDRR